MSRCQTTRRRPPAVSMTPLLLALLVAHGCGGDPPSVPPLRDHECVRDLLDAQPVRRFPVGRTRWLPELDRSGACAGLTWELTSAPEANLNAIWSDRDGQHRFTPHVAGEYVFGLSDGRGELRVNAVEASSLSFHNFSYHPTRSVAAVGDAAYVANVFSSSLTRVDARSLVTSPPLAVGGWPVAVAHSESQGLLVVAQRADDSLGIVDLAANRIIDGVWVGDEPANVVLSADGQRAFVALATEPFVVEVDLEARQVVRRLPGLPDQLGLAVAPDDETLYVATHRSGHSSREPYGDDPEDEERDVVAIDLATGMQTRTWIAVGTTLKALHASADGRTLYVSGLENDTNAGLGDTRTVNFRHQVVALDLESDARDPIVTSDPIGTNSITLHQLIEVGGMLWVVAEGTDQVLGIDAATHEIRFRSDAVGRPRALSAVGDRVLVHGTQALVVSAFDLEGTPVGQSSALDADPRGASLTRGMRYFSGTGRSFARTWSCNSCHADSLTDTVVWNAGPLADRVVPRPFTWLEGAYPLGWAGYLSSVRNYAFTVNNNVGIRPTTEEARDLESYIASLMPPPPGNGWTRRDGRLSALGMEGRALYEGAAGCAGCHALPLTTSRARLETGITPGVSDVPILVGAYRHGVWMKHGEARTFESATEQALAYVGASLGPDESARLTRFLRELTGRDFFVLTSSPRSGSPSVARDATVEIVFSLPVFGDPSNLLHIRWLDADGVAVAHAASAAGRVVTLTPSEPLRAGTRYTLELGASLESESETRLFAATTLSFTTAEAPTTELEGEWVWTVEVPALDFEAGRFDRSSPTPAATPISLTRTISGASALFDYGRSLTYDVGIVMDGSSLVLPPLAVPVGPSFGDSIPTSATLVDLDTDGRGDRAQGTLVMQGPGFVVPEVRWYFERRDVYEACPQGSQGAQRVSVTRAPETTSIAWSGAGARAVYVTAPDATLPTDPEGTIGGDVFFAIEASGAEGLSSPVDPSEPGADGRDAAERHGGAIPLETDACARVTVVALDGSRSDVVMRWAAGRLP